MPRIFLSAMWRTYFAVQPAWIQLTLLKTYLTMHPKSTHKAWKITLGRHTVYQDIPLRTSRRVCLQGLESTVASCQASGRQLEADIHGVGRLPYGHREIGPFGPYDELFGVFRNVDPCDRRDLNATRAPAVIRYHLLLLFIQDGSRAQHWSKTKAARR